jgi:hypothetical protein
MSSRLKSGQLGFVMGIEQRKIFGDQFLHSLTKLENSLHAMEESHKPHRAPHSGAKADKKKAKKNGVVSKKGNNPKAFTMSGSRRAEKIARRSTEVRPVCFFLTI